MTNPRQSSDGATERRSDEGSIGVPPVNPSAAGDTYPTMPPAPEPPENLIELGEIRRSDQLRHPFSLTCCHCDAGDDIDSPEQAWLQGWSEVYEDASGLSWNYLGLCPDCSARGVRV